MTVNYGILTQKWIRVTKKMAFSGFCCRVHVIARKGNPLPHSPLLTVEPASDSQAPHILLVWPLFSPSLAEQTGAAPKSIVYHLDEGVYGVFNSVLFDNTCPTPALQKVSPPL